MMPEKIWAGKGLADWYWYVEPDGKDDVEYIRADIYAAEVDRLDQEVKTLTAERERLNKALEQVKRLIAGRYVHPPPPTRRMAQGEPIMTLDRTKKYKVGRLEFRYEVGYTISGDWWTARSSSGNYVRLLEEELAEMDPVEVVSTRIG